MKPLPLRVSASVLLASVAFYIGRRTAPLEMEKGDDRTLVVEGRPGSAAAAGSASGAAGTRVGASSRPEGWSPLTCSADEFLKRLFREPGVHETQYLLYRSIEEASPQLLVQWAAELVNIPATRSWQPEVLRAVAKRWASLDSAAALEWAQGLPASQGRAAMAAVLGGIATQDTDRALAMAQGLASGPGGNAALIAVADVLRKTDPARAFALVGKMNSYEAQTVIRESMASWAEVDPAAAAAAAAAIPGNNNASNALTSVYNSWALNDPEAALASARGLPNGGKRMGAMSTALNSWAQRDPAAALAFYQSLPDKEQRGYGMGTALGLIAKTDPGKAIAALEGMSPGGRQANLRELASSWAASDMDSALAWASSLKNNRDRANAMNGLAGGMANLDPARQQSIINSLPEGKVRNDFLGSVIGQTAYSDPVSAATMLERMEPHAQYRVLQNSGLMHYLTEADPEKAFQLAAALPGNRSSGYLSSTIERIASSDPARAEQLVLTLAPDQQSQAMGALYGSMAQTDGPGALAKVRGVADEAARKSALATVFSNWASNDADAVLAWVNSATDPAEKSQAMSSAIQVKAQNEPLAAAKLAESLIQSTAPEAQASASRAVSSVSFGLFQESPQQAAKWVAGLPAGSLQEQGISSVASQWVRADPVEASVWIQGLPAGTSRDSAVNNLIGGIQDTDPASAVAWAGSLGEESARNNQMQSVFQNWLQNDKTAAMAALESTPMDAAVKASLMQSAGSQ